MNYFQNFFKKEIKSVLHNKKLLIITLLSQIVIMGFIIKSFNLFHEYGIHSLYCAINVLLITNVVEFFPRSYFSDKETGINNLLILANKFNVTCWFRVLFYSVLMILDFLLANVIFIIVCHKSVCSSIFEFSFYITNCFSYSIIVCFLMVLFEDKNVSSYFLLIVVMIYLLASSLIMPVLVEINPIFLSLSGVFIALILALALQLLIKFTHGVSGK